MPYVNDDLTLRLEDNYIAPTLVRHILLASYEGEHKLQQFLRLAMDMH